MPIDPSQIRVLGPLSTFTAGFADELAYQGYTPNSARFQIWLMAHLSSWLANEGLDAGDLVRVHGLWRVHGSDCRTVALSVAI